MTQTIITGIIITVAAILALVMIVKTVKRRKKAKDPCGGCSSDCGGCAIHDLMKEADEKKKNNIG